MKSFTNLFSRTAPTVLMLMSLWLLSLGCQFAQAAPVACTFTIPGGLAHSFTGNGGSFGVTVNASEASCTWTAKSNSSWLKVTNGENRTGNALVYITVDRNNGEARNGSLNIAGHIYFVHQGAACEYTLQKTSQDIGKLGGEFSVAVTATALCNWDVEPLVNWIKVKGNATFDNSGTAAFTVEENTGAARIGKLSMAGKDFTVNQAGTCSYAVSPTSQNVPSGGGIYPVNVTATGGCAWTSTYTDTWAKITSGPSGTGNGTISYTVTPNTGAARTAFLTVATKQITISQDAGQPALLPTLADVNPGFVVAGTPSMTVTLTGTNFTIGSKARWNGEDRVTTFVSPTQLKVTLLNTDLKTAATNKITVYESSTDKTSNAQHFLVLSPQASVSAASYKSEAIAPDSIVAAFGAKLADSTAVASTIPLPASLAGTTVRVIDSKNLERVCPLFFVSVGQVNYLMPGDMPIGPATVVITTGSGTISVGYVNVARVAPGIFTANANGAGVPAAAILRIKADGAQAYELISRFDQASQKVVAVPIEPAVVNEQVFLVLYGTGMRYHGGLNGVSLNLGGTPVGTSYLGVSGLAGLDQLNARLPASLAGRGEIDLVLSVDGKTANTVKLTFK